MKKILLLIGFLLSCVVMQASFITKQEVYDQMAFPIITSSASFGISRVIDGLMVNQSEETSNAYAGATKFALGCAMYKGAVYVDGIYNFTKNQKAFDDLQIKEIQSAQIEELDEFLNPIIEKPKTSNYLYAVRAIAAVKAIGSNLMDSGAITCVSTSKPLRNFANFVMPSFLSSVAWELSSYYNFNVSKISTKSYAKYLTVWHVVAPLTTKVLTASKVCSQRCAKNLVEFAKGVTIHAMPASNNEIIVGVHLRVRSFVESYKNRIKVAKEALDKQQIDKDEAQIKKTKAEGRVEEL